MKAGEMWKKFCNEKGISEDTPYEAWSFGDEPDKLAQLVLAGKKTATASAYDLYELDSDEKLPEKGDYSVVLNSKDEAVCVIQTTKTYVSLFMDVSEEHARKEGEGDLSLSYWRKVHEEFFTGEYESCGMIFDKNTARILCEEFQIIHA